MRGVLLCSTYGLVALCEMQRLEYRTAAAQASTADDESDLAACRHRARPDYESPVSPSAAHKSSRR